MSNLTLHGVPIHVSVSCSLCGSLPGTSHLQRPVAWSRGMPICLSLLVGLAAPSRSLTHHAAAATCLKLMALCSHLGTAPSLPRTHCLLPDTTLRTCSMVSWPAAHCSHLGIHSILHLPLQEKLPIVSCTIPPAVDERHSLSSASLLYCNVISCLKLLLP